MILFPPWFQKINQKYITDPERFSTLQTMALHDKKAEQSHMSSSATCAMLWLKRYSRINTVFDLITTPALITASPSLDTLFSLNIAHLTISFLTFYLIFTCYRPLDDLLALVLENNFM